MISEESRKRRKRLEEKRKEDERAEIEIPVNILMKIAALRNSEFKQSFVAVERERAANITTPILIKIAEYNKIIFSSDENLSLVLLELLTERSNHSNNTEEQQEIDRITFSVACTSAFAEVRKQAAQMLEKMVREEKITELAKKFLA